MENAVTPTRIKIGTGCGCSEYSDQERAMLNDLLSLPRQMRFSVIHKALRVYCQTLIASAGKGAGYPGTLDDVMRLMGTGVYQADGSVVLGSHTERAVRHGESVDRRAQSDPDPVKRVAETGTEARSEPTVSDHGQSPESEFEPEPSPEPGPEPDEHTEWVKGRMAQFMA